MIKCYPCEFRIYSIKITMPMVRPYTIKRNTTMLDVNTILNVIADYCTLTIDDLKSDRRFRPLVEARTYAAYFLQKYIHQITLKQIGIHLGGRDHTTVIYLINSCNDLMFSDKEFKNNVFAIEAILKKIFIVDVENSIQDCTLNNALNN